MREEWTGDLIGRMHNAEVSMTELAQEMNVKKPYVSMILNGHRSPKGGRERLEAAFNNIIRRRAVAASDSE